MRIRKPTIGVNDLSTTHPEIAKLWDYEKNGELSPSSFSAGSNEYVFWKCDKGHSFRSSIYNMTHSKKGNNCPVCRNFVILPGFNDLATTNPELVNEWDKEKNVIDITEVGSGTNKKAFWKCLRGHSWEAVISSRAINHNGCPYCSNQKVWVGDNDLATLYPRVLKFWDYSKNTTSPSDYAGIQSQKSVWLKCDKNHSWKTKIADFTRGNGCPYCSNKRIEAGFNDLATTHPELAKEWDFEKNIGITPNTISYGSDKKVWWKCEKGHSWEATINSRVSGKGCPLCLRETQTSVTEKAFGYYLSKYFDDLKENVHLPELGKRELDIYIPSLKLAIEYDGHNWHKHFKNDLIKDNICKQNEITLIRIREEGCAVYNSSAYFINAPQNHGNLMLLEQPINELINMINQLYSLSIPNIKNIEDDISFINERFYTQSKSNSLLANNPKLAKEWNSEKNGSLLPSMIAVKSNQKVWWKCEKGHEWLANVQSRDRGNGCPYCSGKYVLKGFNDLATLNSTLSLEWDYAKNDPLSPEDVTVGSDKKVWWICSHGHSWSAPIANRNKGAGCPYCSGLYSIKGENDLATLFPEIASQWDNEKNSSLTPSDIGPGCEKKVWWICDKGHSYPAVVRSRAMLKTGCPVCQNKRVLAGLNDLATLHPELAKEWNDEKNGELLPTQVGGNGGSHKKVWWKCEKGHEWPATLASRIRLKTGCPVCAIDKTRKKK